MKYRRVSARAVSRALADTDNISVASARTMRLGSDCASLPTLITRRLSLPRVIPHFSSIPRFLPRSRLQAGQFFSATQLRNRLSRTVLSCVLCGGGRKSNFASNMFLMGTGSHAICTPLTAFHLALFSLASPQLTPLQADKKTEIRF